MTEKNCEYQGKVIDFGVNGEGVIRRDDLTVFVPFVITGETVYFKVLKTDNSIAYGKLTRIIEPSDKRVVPKCPVYGKCGGCTFQHVDYSETLKIKRQNVINTFRKVALMEVDAENTVPSEFQYGYRNKLQLPVQQVNGEPLIGFYATNSHRIVPIDDCPINPCWTKKIISVFKKYLSFEGVNAYDPINRKGLIREITVKQAGGLFITVVCTCADLPHKNELIELLKQNFEEFSLYINVNDNDNNVIYGEKFIKIYGNDFYSCEFSGVKFTADVKSFSQVNDDVCKKLYEKAVGSVVEDSPSVVFDAYSGAGITTAMIAKYVDRVYGIEVVEKAVECANVVARNNGLSGKITNICGKTEDVLPELIKQTRGKTAMLLDPPRKGCDEKVIKSILTAKPDKIVYVSCMPSTLARDVGLLCGTLTFGEKGIIKSDGNGVYKIKTIIPFDMFPQTKHVETLCVLTLK